MDIRKVICFVFLLFELACSELPEAPNKAVPEFSVVSSTVYADSVLLTARLSSKPNGDLICGFRFGKDSNDLQSVRSEMGESAEFQSLLLNLDDTTTYHFLAFVSNGRNEITSKIQKFITIAAESEQEKPEPDIPENPDTPKEPEEPNEPNEPNEPEVPEDPYFIRFADNLIGDQCIAAFDSDKDGALSYEEAASVTDLSQMNLVSRAFTSFDELKYFTSLTVIPGQYFRSCTRMTSITLPESIQCISDEAFKNCSALSRINIPKELKEILRLAFEGCRSLKRVDLSSLETFLRLDYGKDQPGLNHPLNSRASLYLSGSELTDIVVPESITEIKDFALIMCTNLKSISLHGGITNVGQQAFDNCTALEEVHIHDNVSSFETGTFYGCTSLRKIILPKAMYEIPEAMFSGCSSLQEVTIQENVTMIGHNSFDGCSLRTVTLTGIYPPAISPETFSRSTTFRVPQEAVETYRTAQDWSIHKDRITGF